MPSRCKRFIVSSVGFFLPLAALPSPAVPGEEPAAAVAAAMPVTTVGGPAGDLLRQWWAEGSAAGNDGDRYDNRDRGHSLLDITAYPQLGKLEYKEEERKKNLDWGLQTTVLPGVVFGNSSTSAPVLLGGSNIRQYYLNPNGLQFLFTQYARSNLYIYPEHLDHDPGHNGVGGGWGDVFPTNTPYLIASQGSSGSDQPFMRAIPLTLAAFRPEVKKILVRSGLLMPTMQMILRSTGKQLADSASAHSVQQPKNEYLTGKAHPTVFEGASVDELKMVQLAHDIRPGTIPPLAVLKVVEEDPAGTGRDFADAADSEKLADTPCAIARVLRGTAYQRRMLVSAEQSIDVNRAPLTFHWAVLRGDADRVRITPRNKQGSVAEVVVTYPERRPVLPGSSMESNRVDIGVFVHNGSYFSAPSFITFEALDWEGRTYDAGGRLLDIGYDMGVAVLNVSDWDRLLAIFKSDTPAGQLLRDGMKDAEVAALLEAAGEYETDLQAVQASRKPSAVARPIKASAKPSVAGQTADDGGHAADEVLSKQRPALKTSPRALLEGRLNAMLHDPEFLIANEAALLASTSKDMEKKSVLKAAHKQLAGYGMVAPRPGERLFDITPLRAGSAPLAQRLTKIERATLERLNGWVLANVLYNGAATSQYLLNYVDARLSPARLWRDVYHYDAHGKATGWTRYDGETASDYNRAGQRVLEKDAKGRCIRAAVVKYEPNATIMSPAGWDVGPNFRPLKPSGTGRVFEYEYDGDDDFIGRVKGSH